jgi:hypothetical protein
MLYTDCSVVDIECLCCPRRTPCSTLQRFAPFADCSALDTWPSAPYLDCSLPGVSRPVLFSARSFRFAPCSALSASASALDCSSLVAALLAPDANCFALDTWPSASRSDCSSLDASRPALPADRSAGASLNARTRHELLRARHLAFRIAPGSLLADRSVLVASRPALLADCSALNA